MIGTGVLFGLAPALRSVAHRRGRRCCGTTPAPPPLAAGLRRLRNALVALQVAVSLVLVLGAGLLARSLRRSSTWMPAWTRTGSRTCGPDFSTAGLTGDEIRVALEEIQARTGALPGVTATAATSRLPAQEGGSTTTVVEGYEPAAGTGAVELDYAVVTPGYFGTVGQSLLEGRDFGPDDVLGSETVMLVNESAARHFWPGQSALGRRMRPQDRPDAWRRVVGVVADAPVDRLGEATPPMFYFSTGQSAPYSAYVVARTDGNPTALLAGMRGAVGEVRATLAVQEQGTLGSHFGASLGGPRFATAAMGAFSLMGLVLAALGIYAVVAFSVARRSAELGIRMALGADRGGLVRAVVAEIVITVGLGLAVGIALCFLGAPLLAGALYGVAPLDPMTFGGSVLLLLAASAVAAWLPARRAATLDPVAALRG